MDTNQAYQRLKRKMIEQAENQLDLQQLCTHFKEQIFSARDLSNLKNIEDLLYLLEVRDCLSPDDIIVFEYLASQLQNPDICVLLRVYKKLYIDDASILCSCGLPKSFKDECESANANIRLVSSPQPIVQQQQNVDDNNDNDELEDALKNLAQRLGYRWRILASELKVIEYHIDRVRKDYPEDFVQQARTILQIWKMSNRQTASISLLDKALQSRHCKRFGLGSHLRQPVVGLTH